MTDPAAPVAPEKVPADPRTLHDWQAIKTNLEILQNLQAQYQRLGFLIEDAQASILALQAKCAAKGVSEKDGQVLVNA